MGYFPNGTAGMDYEERYCSRCVHQGPPDGPGCAVMLAHMLENYNECNNPKSILHLLIPKSKDGLDNLKCAMFMTTEKRSRIRQQKNQPDLFPTKNAALQHAALKLQPSTS
jgi:hypothetical protein